MTRVKIERFISFKELSTNHRKARTSDIAASFLCSRKMTMNVTQSDIDFLTENWNKLSKEAEAYLDRVWQILVRQAGGTDDAYGIAAAPEILAEADIDGTVASLMKEIPKCIVKLIEASKSSPVVSDVDRGDLRVSMREILATLKFRCYQHWGTNILNEEDRVLGVERPRQR